MAELPADLAANYARNQAFAKPGPYTTALNFSNESRYANFDAPRWIENRLIDKDGNVVFDETPR